MCPESPLTLLFSNRLLLYLYVFGEYWIVITSRAVQCQSDYYLFHRLMTTPVSPDIGIIFMSPDMLSLCDVPGWSSDIFSATPLDSPLWRALLLWPTAATYHPRFFPSSLFSNCHHNMLNLGSVRKSQIASKCLSRSDFFGQDKKAWKK